MPYLVIISIFGDTLLSICQIVSMGIAGKNVGSMNLRFAKWALVKLYYKI